MEPDLRQSVDLSLLPPARHSSDESRLSHKTRAPSEDDRDSAGARPKEPQLDSPKKGQKRGSIHNLLYEILSLLVSAASLAILIAVLSKYDNKPTPKWSLGPLGITLNAIVSILSTVFRGSLLMPVAQSISQFCWIWYTQPRPLRDVCDYDAASRGPLGSIRLLFRLRFIRFASIGAVITVAALALDPFFQQSVRYHSESAVDHDRNATAVAAYTWGTDIVPDEDLLLGYIALPYDMQVAMHTGVLSGNLVSFPDPPFMCPSGNCTWNPYNTLAISSKCIDITSHAKIDCDSGCHFTASEDIVMQNLLSRVDESGGDYLNDGADQWDPFRMEFVYIPDALPVLRPWADITGLLAMVQWVKATGPETLTLSSTTTFEAMQCGFYISVQVLVPTVHNGVYSEAVIREYVQSDNANSTPTFTANDTSFYFLNAYEGLTPAPPNLTYHPPIATPNQSPTNSTNTTFTFPFNAYYALTSQFLQAGFLTGDITRNATAGMNGPDNAIMLYRAANVTHAMHGLAQYMTTVIRAVGSTILKGDQQNNSVIAADHAVAGSVFVQKQFVAVRWAWLTLPIVLLVLAVVLLAVAWWETRRLGVGLWQSSPLALFFHGRMEGGARGFEGVGGVDTAEGMRGKAEGLWARIPREARGTVEVYEKDSLGKRGRSVGSSIELVSHNM
ncbi:uncharacterized protein BDZ99DRAFT_501742 [Mytilinidion resinicola]|uniref:Uncharacterized protein n=1 Tax=Mytilinidion resinicola TaxID=574789 RepID=A0A6A6Y9N0_9PEZI|nr:uncharacterized protein BDZ99DRAFT_501742 [Mytilinidion resinicola]KAF2805532.1 hypothetical protein BDZ99DRAFT_501742 [Mytilinidion resinicola]